MESGGGRAPPPQSLLGHQTALAKLRDELSANEFETDNEVPFGDTWAEKNEGKSAPGGARLGIFFFFLNPKHAGKTNPLVYSLHRVPEAASLPQCWAGSESGTHVWPGHMHVSRELQHRRVSGTGSPGHTRAGAAPPRPPPPRPRKGAELSSLLEDEDSRVGS